MIKKFGRKNIIPNAMSDEEANNVYHIIYTPEDEDKY